MEKTLPEEILSQIVRSCIDADFSIEVFERNPSSQHAKTCTVYGLPDVSELRLVNQVFNEEIKANLAVKFGGKLQLEVDGFKCFSAKSAQLFDPKRGHLCWILPLVHELRVKLSGMGPAVLKLVDKMRDLKQVTIFHRAGLGNEREEVVSESDVVSGLHDGIAFRELRRVLNPMDASKMLTSSLEQLRKKPIKVLLEMTVHDYQTWPHDSRLGTYDMTWTCDLGSRDIVHRAAVACRPPKP